MIFFAKLSKKLFFQNCIKLIENYFLTLFYDFKKKIIFLKFFIFDENCSNQTILFFISESTEIVNLNASRENDVKSDDEQNDFENEPQLESFKTSIIKDLADIQIEQQQQSDTKRSELDVKPAAIEYKTHFSYGFDDDDEIKTDDLNHLEPKLRDAWIEMRRLDKVLKRVSDKEKRVKTETKSLVEKYRVELDLLKMTSDRKESQQEQENTANYISLTYLDRNNELEDDDESKTGKKK